MRLDISKLTNVEKLQYEIASKVLNTPDAIVAVMGPYSKKEAHNILQDLRDKIRSRSNTTLTKRVTIKREA